MLYIPKHKPSSATFATISSKMHRTFTILCALVYLQMNLKQTTAADPECSMKFVEQPPTELGCRPYDNNQLWRLRMACEARIPLAAELRNFKVHWYQRTRDGNVINHGQPDQVYSRDRAQRVAFGGDWINQKFESSMLGDYWCQVTLTDSNMIIPTTSAVVSIREPTTYDSNLPVCSSVQSTLQETCIFPNTANEIDNVVTISSTTSSSSSTSTVQSSSSSTSSSVIHSTSVIQIAASSTVQTTLQSTNQEIVATSTKPITRTTSLPVTSTVLPVTSTVLPVTSTVIPSVSSSSTVLVPFSSTVLPSSYLPSINSHSDTASTLTVQSTSDVSSTITKLPPSIIPPFGTPTETNSNMLSLVIALVCSLTVLVIVLLIVLLCLINKWKKRVNKGLGTLRLSKLSKRLAQSNKNKMTKITPYYIQPNSTQLTIVSIPIEPDTHEHSPVTTSDSIHSYESLTTTTEYVSIYDIPTAARNYASIDPTSLNNNVYTDLQK